MIVRSPNIHADISLEVRVKSTDTKALLSPGMLLKRGQRTASLNNSGNCNQTLAVALGVNIKRKALDIKGGLNSLQYFCRTCRKTSK